MCPDPHADSQLDRAVFAASAALSDHDMLQPAALLFAATGCGLLPGRLDGARQLALGRLPGTPTCWESELLHSGYLNGLPVWLVGDESDELVDDRAPGWTAAFPVWLAAAAGAASLVHVAAACSLGELEHGALAFASDHLNLSGGTPLVGLGESRLGPMFPDQSRLHDAELRADALEICAQLGLVGAEGVFACSPAPALETPAEQRWYREAGAAVSVQGLIAPLHAAAHSGLGVLSIGVVVARAGERMDVGRIASTARELAPSLDDLLLELASATEGRARSSLGEERS